MRRFIHVFFFGYGIVNIMYGEPSLLPWVATVLNGICLILMAGSEIGDKHE